MQEEFYKYCKCQKKYNFLKNKINSFSENLTKKIINSVLPELIHCFHS